MKNITKRLLNIDLPERQSAFLWGPRRTGKTYWISQHCADALLIDLLKTDVFADYASRPSLLRERFWNHTGLIVIDEIQMLPDLLNEIHWMIENTGASFLMSGSSARKLRRSHANLLAGRAWRYAMKPISFMETEGFELEEVFVSGLLPPHYISHDPVQDLRSYVGDYLKEEIAAEASVQHIPSFAEFLRIAALTSGELINYTNIGRESGVSAKVVRNYFQILEDTMLGFRVQPWRKAKRRRLIETEKFYLFDVGISNYLSRRTPKTGTPEFGHSFEHYILMELKAYQAYRNPELDIRYWRTSTGFEVDFILGDMQVALEVKGSKKIHRTHFRSLKALREEHPLETAVVVSLEDHPRRMASGIEVLPWQDFLRRLWAGELGV